jgi:diketogulonate reductase-like aldo/keto reductase
MSDGSRDGAPIPALLYGTAWKEDRTEPLTLLALEQGFRGIDTANQRRHYHEAAVGKALSTVIERGVLSRSDLFVQSKFTFQRGQDHRPPYDPAVPIATQVAQSFDSSLNHLGVETLDSYLLHGPSRRIGLGTDDWNAWRAMEALQESGRVRWIGISNVNLQQLQQLCGSAHIQPRFVQNRCYASQGWDRQVREFCKRSRITYQGFSLLTANQQLLARPEMSAIAKRYGKTIAQIVFRFVMDLGMLPLTGTSNTGHMRLDLDVIRFALEQEEVTMIEKCFSQSE